MRLASLGGCGVERRRLVADGIIKDNAIASMAVGLVPVPLFDLAAFVALQSKQTRDLAWLYDVRIADDRVGTAVTVLFDSTAPVLAGPFVFSALKLLPGLGSLAGSAGVSLASAVVSIASGRIVVEQLEAGSQTLALDGGEWRAAWMRHWAAARREAKDLMAGRNLSRAVPSTPGCGR